VSHTHTHIFDEEISEENRQAWLTAAFRRATINLERLSVFTIRNCRGYEMHFETLRDYAAFFISTYGDCYRPGSHIHEHCLSGAADIKWLEAVTLYLETADIDCKILHKEEKIQFIFDRFSDRVALQCLIEDGLVDSLVEHGFENELPEAFHTQIEEWLNVLRPHIRRGLLNGPPLDR